MQIDNVNLFAVLAAAVSNFLIGGLWYSPALFHRAWMRENGFSEEDLRRGNPAVIFGLAFLCCLLMAGNLAGFLSGPDTDVTFGIVAGVLAGLGWVALGIVVVALFERRSWRYMLINGGYFAVSFAVMGAILGAWR